MAFGWIVTVLEANTYFLEQRLNTTAWDALTIDSTINEKEKVLMNAYNRILYDDRLSIPASPTAAQLVILKLAQCEYSYYLAQHLNDEDRRMGLQAQHVTKAGVVEETYDKDRLDALPIPQFVLAILAPFLKATVFAAVNIDRDEEESVDEDVTGF
jgi:hypothetical protein